MEASSITVDRLKRTVAPHGTTGAELRRFSGALHLMKKRIRIKGELWWLTTPKGVSRDKVAAIQKRITRLQRDQGFYSYSAWVFETRPKLHAHIVFVGNSEIAAALKRSAICRGCNVALVHHPDVVKDYLAKERTPQAGYRRSDLGGRIRGSHPIQGGGDRVRLSRELERDALEAGLIQDWRHTNAKRSPERKRRRLQRLYPKKALRLSGQMLLFPEMSKPVARLQFFGGGFVPAAVAVEIEFRRRQRGLSQRELAQLIGRSQGQYANAIRGHDPLSAAAVNRLRDVLLRTEARRRQQRCQV